MEEGVTGDEDPGEGSSGSRVTVLGETEKFDTDSGSVSAVPYPNSSVIPLILYINDYIGTHIQGTTHNV